MFLQKFRQCQTKDRTILFPDNPGFFLDSSFLRYQEKVESRKKPTGQKKESNFFLSSVKSVNRTRLVPTNGLFLDITPPPNTLFSGYKCSFWLQFCSLSHFHTAENGTQSCRMLTPCATLKKNYFTAEFNSYCHNCAVESTHNINTRTCKFAFSLKMSAFVRRVRVCQYFYRYKHIYMYHVRRTLYNVCIPNCLKADRCPQAK